MVEDSRTQVFVATLVVETGTLVFVMAVVLAVGCIQAD